MVRSFIVVDLSPGPETGFELVSAVPRADWRERVVSLPAPAELLAVCAHCGFT